MLSPRSPPSLTERKSSWSQSSSRNPISLRLYKVLGTNYDDHATKEALQTLSSLYASTSVTSSAKGKEKEIVSNVEDMEEDEEEFEPRRHGTANVNASSAEAELVPGESAARARKNLRRDMENKLAEGSHKFLKVFGEVDQKLDELQAHVSAMRASCDEAETQLQLTSEASNTLLERAGNLREERQEVETKKSIVSLFLARFTLTEEEIQCMTSRDVPMGLVFFQAMDKTEHIRTDCRVLMSGEDGPTKAGLDIMASTSSYLEQAFEKIVRWCSYEFRQIGRDGQLEVSPTMRESVRRLRKRAELLTEVLGILSETRQSALSSSFLTALTRGGPGGLPRPIELHAHDPLRYIGDMLAWVHQAIAAEQEFLESLFGLKGDGRMVGSVRIFPEAKGEKGEGDVTEWIREMMDLGVGKVCVPLKVRVQQTVRSQESSIVSYKIANLLQFYMITMRRTVGGEALLSKTLHDITDLAYKAFYDAIEAQSHALLRVTLEPDDPSLTPPFAILDHFQVLREIMTVYQSSLLGDEDTEQQINGFERVLDIMVDPAIDMCVKMGEEKQRVRPRWDDQVFILNCLSYVLSVLESYDFTLQKQSMVQQLVDERVVMLTDEHYENIMSDAGLSTVAHTIQNHDTTEPLSHIPATQPSSLQSALSHFASWLSLPDVVSSPRLSHLTTQKLHTQIHHAALLKLGRTYGEICDSVRREENRYEAGATMLGSERPFGRVGALWQIFGIDDEGV